MNKSWSSTGHINGSVFFKHQQTPSDTIMQHHSRSERTSLFETGEEWRASGTAGSATDLAVAHSNEGANCRTLQVAAGNLQRGEKRAEAGHKQRLLAVGGRWEAAAAVCYRGRDASERPQSCSARNKEPARCYYQQNCPNNYTSSPPGREGICPECREMGF